MTQLSGMKIFPKIHSKVKNSQPMRKPNQLRIPFKKAMRDTKPIKFAAMFNTNEMAADAPLAAASKADELSLEIVVD